MSTLTGTVRRADQPKDYQHFSVNPTVVEEREDGQREDPKQKGTFEWWYFEVTVPGQAAIVVAFLTKPFEHQDGALRPMVSIKILLTNAKHPVGDDFEVCAASFHASDDRCEVRAGGSSCEYLGSGLYQLKLHEGNIAGKIDLQALAVAPPSRIGTGHLLFEGGSDSQYFGWLVPIPIGAADVDLMIGNTPVKGHGGAYHDHNWGDRPMAGPVHHWYWGRAFVDGVLVIAANTVPQATYGGVDHLDLVLMKDGKFITQGEKNVSYKQSGVSNDPNTGKPVADVIIFSFVADDGTEYVCTFARHITIVTKSMGDLAYHRFGGEFMLQVSGDPVVHRTNMATWELMWMGENPSLVDFKVLTEMLSDPAASLPLPP